MRLQLTRALVAVALVASSPSARADDEWTVSTDALVYGDTDNVVVVSPQVAVRRALDNNGGEVSARAVVDVISAASVDVVSQASQRFEEVRSELNLSVGKAFGHTVPSLAYRYSHEPDYESHGVTGGLQLRLGSPDSVLGLEYGRTFDDVRRTGTPASVFSENLTSHAAGVSFTQVLNRRTLVRAAYSLTVQRGYMEKPYRFVPLFDRAGIDAAAAAGVALDLDSFDSYRLDARPPEQVPDSRQRHAIGVRGLRYVDGLHSSVKLDYQLYADDWGVVAHTFEPSLQTGLSDDVSLMRRRLGQFGVAVYSRLYVQSAADFWQRTYVVDAPDQIPHNRTVDRDLSSYWSATGGARLDWKRGALSGYLDASAMYTSYDNYLYLTQRLALVTLGGFRWAL